MPIWRTLLAYTPSVMVIATMPSDIRSVLTMRSSMGVSLTMDIRIDTIESIIAVMTIEIPSA